MKISAAWINAYLDPPASAAEQADLLTRAGFPIESTEQVGLPDGSVDMRQDVELTSNRGDCLCHLGLAREIAAVSGRALRPPTVMMTVNGPPAASIVTVINQDKKLCPLYTARVIRGVTVKPSPAWLANRLIARGDIPRNAIVDASNFVLFELGQPTHVFDLQTLKDSQVIIRRARSGERFLPIGEAAAEVTLTDRDLVIADVQRAVAIAGVKGGALTAVTAATTDIFIEAATFDPVAVRNTSRRLGIASDSSYRFERGVDPGQVQEASDRLAQLVVGLCGGELCEGIVADGAPIAAPRHVTMRCDRSRKILGVAASDQQMAAALDRLGFEAKLAAGVVACTIPYPRIDIEREIDLIEEVGRMIGHDAIPIAQTIRIRVAPPQGAELARRAVSDALVGMGYLETVTHSLIDEQAAAAFTPPDMEALRVRDAGTRAEPILRPSIIPSLLQVLAANRDAGVVDARLFEGAATFGAWNGRPVETANLTIVHPAVDPEVGLRELRGALDRIVQIVLGRDVAVEVRKDERLPWFAPGAGAAAFIAGDVIGTFGLLKKQVTTLLDVWEPVLAAEIGLPAYYDRYPPEADAQPLPLLPSIERDVSAIVAEHVTWGDVKDALQQLRLAHAEAIGFITAFRGRQIGPGRKSITVRVRFRAADRTLKHDEADAQMEAVMSELQSRFGAEIRT